MHILRSTAILASLFASLAFAAPQGSGSSDVICDRRDSGTDKMIAALKVIAPTSAQSPCVDQPQGAGECRSAEQAAGPILDSFDKYKVPNLAEQAALVSLMALESVEFHFDHNISPGVPGQGTRNMQSPHFNLLYAESIPELQSQLDKVENDVVAVLALLTSNDDIDFGSAAWFLTSQCSSSVRTQLQSGTEAGWVNYITQCVGTTATDQRRQYWVKAMKEIAGVTVPN